MNQKQKNVAHSIFQRLLTAPEAIRKISIFCSRVTARSVSFTGSEYQRTMTGLFSKAPVCFWCGKGRITYPRYTLVAENLEAMIKLSLANSRMKDFYDIWLLSRLFAFDGDVLRKAIKNTFWPGFIKEVSASPESIKRSSVPVRLSCCGKGLFCQTR